MSIAWITWLIGALSSKIMSIAWITWLMDWLGLDTNTDSPPADDADHLTLSSDCVRYIARQVAAARGTILALKQCRDLSSKLLKTIGNIQELVSQLEASSTTAFRPALQDFHRIVEKSKLLVQECSRADWCKASVFQILNEEAFREILLEVGLCYNVIYELANAISLADELNLEVEDLRHGPTFLPTNQAEVLEDQNTLQKRLEELAKRSGTSNDQIIARYLLPRLIEGTSENRSIEDACIMYDESLLGVTTSELRATWDAAQLEPIGSGGGVCVFITKWNGIPCAKKFFLHVDDDTNFRKEAALLASLNHANVVKFFCCGSEGERKCVIGMELMEMSLGELIGKRKKLGRPFPILVALDIILQIARGMLYLHDLHIAHRDLKPQNVVVSKTKHANTFCVKLLDFGMSRTKIQVSKSTTVSSKNIGTTVYRAPEAFSDAAHLSDPAHGKQRVKWFRADVYSFAVTCYSILSLEQPYANAGTGNKLYKKLMTGTRPEIPSECPRALSELLIECWAENYNARPKFSDICERLERFKHDQLLNLPVVITEGRTQDALPSSYTYIARMMTERSQLRSPKQHQLAAVASDEETAVNASDDEPEAPEEPTSEGMNLEWISKQTKTFTVSRATGDVDDGMKKELRKACEAFCKQIDLTRIPTTEERGQMMQDIVDHLKSAFPKYNVMVVYPKHLEHFRECAHCSITLKIADLTIGSAQVYVFKHGDFTLLGDAGFINWCFKGNHQRDNYKVTFWDPLLLPQA